MPKKLPKKAVEKMIQTDDPTDSTGVSTIARSDDVPDFETYATQQRQHLVRVAYLLCGDSHTAEDLVQTTLAKLYLAWDRASRADSLDAYTRRVLINEHHSWWRRAFRRRERSVEQTPDRGVTDAQASDPQLWNLVTELPTRQRAVIVLRYYEQLTQAEISDALGISPGTVKSQTSRALANLRRHTNELGEEQS